MPFIVKDKEQELALQEMTAKMELLQGLAELNDKAYQSVSITFHKGGRGKAAATKIELLPTEKTHEKELKKLEGLLGDYRKRLAKEVMDSAKKYRIEFTEEEQLLLAGNAPATQDANEE